MKTFSQIKKSIPNNLKPFVKDSHIIDAMKSHYDMIEKQPKKQVVYLFGKEKLNELKFIIKMISLLAFLDLSKK